MKKNKEQTKNFISKENLFSLGVLVGVLLITFQNSFRGPFIFDDIRAIVENPFVHGFSWKTVLATNRPLVDLTLAFNFSLGGLNVMGYHIVNLALHVLNAFLLLLIVKNTLLSPKFESVDLKAMRWIPLSIALLWMVHPLQTQSVNYIIQRAELMMGTFYLLMFYGFTQSKLSPCKTAWLRLSYLSFFAGLFCKSIIITAPFVLIFFERVFYAGSMKSIFKKYAVYFVALALGGLLNVILTGAALSGVDLARYNPSVGFGIESVHWLEYLRTQPAIVLNYLKLCFNPLKLCIDYQWPIASGFYQVILPSLVMLAIVVGFFICYRFKPVIAFLGLSTFIILLPTSSFIPLVDLAFEHRMYLSLIGVVSIVVLSLQALFFKMLRRSLAQPVFLLCIGFLCAALSFISFQRNVDYQSILSIWQDVIQKQGEADVLPHEDLRISDDIRSQLIQAGEFMKAGEYAKADEIYDQYVLKVPGNYRAYHNIGLTLQDDGKLEEAIESYKKALSIYPTYAESMNNLANCYSALGQKLQALKQFRILVKLTPNDADVYSNMGNVLSSLGKKQDAILYFERAIRLNPQLAIAYYNLGAAYHQMGNKELAKKHFLKALQINPHFSEAKKALLL